MRNKKSLYFRFKNKDKIYEVKLHRKFIKRYLQKINYKSVLSYIFAGEPDKLQFFFLTKQQKLDLLAENLYYWRWYMQAQKVIDILMNILGIGLIFLTYTIVILGIVFECIYYKIKGLFHG